MMLVSLFLSLDNFYSSFGFHIFMDTSLDQSKPWRYLDLPYLLSILSFLFVIYVLMVIIFVSYVNGGSSPLYRKSCESRNHFCLILCCILSIKLGFSANRLLTQGAHSVECLLLKITCSQNSVNKAYGHCSFKNPMIQNCQFAFRWQ